MNTWWKLYCWYHLSSLYISPYSHCIYRISILYQFESVWVIDVLYMSRIPELCPEKSIVSNRKYLTSDFWYQLHRYVLFVVNLQCLHLSSWNYFICSCTCTSTRWCLECCNSSIQLCQRIFLLYILVLNSRQSAILSFIRLFKCEKSIVLSSVLSLYRSHSRILLHVLSSYLIKIYL